MGDLETERNLGKGTVSPVSLTNETRESLQNTGAEDFELKLRLMELEIEREMRK